MGPGDGAGDAELWKDVECVYGSALKRLRYNETRDTRIAAL